MILISKDLEEQFKIKISEKRPRFEDILASFFVRGRVLLCGLFPVIKVKCQLLLSILADFTLIFLFFYF